MNRIHRIIWSAIREKWIVVSEKASARGCPIIAVGALSLALLQASLVMPAFALDPGALPNGGQVVSGRADISTAGNQMTINQSSPQLIANWQSFNIGEQASVWFNQPDAGSSALNRIADQNPTEILGSLSANGQVMLVNPSGILFGKTARVDVGGLVASTLNISNSDYLSGKYVFVNGGGAGKISNEGSITAASGGVVAFIAPQAGNSGTVRADGGSVAMLGGDQVTVSFADRGLFSYIIDKGAVNPLLENSGSLQADGGLVAMSAKDAQTLKQLAVNTSGVVRARSLQQKEGRIILSSEGGEARVTGTLDASSPDGKGGTVTVTGAHVGLFDNARIDASGATGGGTVLVGGDWQGSGTLAHAEAVVMAHTATIDASAKQQGDGGKVVVVTCGRPVPEAGGQSRRKCLMQSCANFLSPIHDRKRFHIVS